MADIERVVESDFRPVEATLLDVDGSPMNLVGTNVWFRATDSFSDTVLFDSKASIIDEEGGQVKYTFDSSDLSEPGFYEAKFRVVFGPSTNDPKKAYFPNDDDITISVEPE